MQQRKRVGIIGARGHTGSELIRLVAGHSGLELAFVSSRELDGQRVSDHNPDFTGDLRYENLDPEAAVARGVDAVVLALPNGKSAPFVAAFDALSPIAGGGEGTSTTGASAASTSGKSPPHPSPLPREQGRGSEVVIVDLSADYRFDPGWYYGLPELTRKRYAGQRRIANPGCYATAMQLAIAPLKEVLAGPPQCFGVSGYSGAGTTPSDKNDVEKLRDNLMPYSLTDHIHEREVSAQMGLPVEFMPHVAPHFRGITMTLNLWLDAPMSREAVRARFLSYYGGEPLVTIQDEAPWVSQIAQRHGAVIGGFTMSPDGRRVVLVSVLDNLLKGAATQAMQNLNLALGFDEMKGIQA